jgi:SAM-dependent methyltransferase
MGWEAMGCEPDRSAVDVCRNAGLDVVHGDVFDEQLDRRQFDVVTANHVIEHVTDVERTLSRIHSIVKPGGTVWFAFPNPDCLSLKLFKAAAVILHIPYHLCMPSQRRFCEMLECAGFTDARVTRRGVQSKSNWIHSAKIAEEQGLPQPARLKVWLARLLSEMLSVFSGKWGEETVFVARKM